MAPVWSCCLLARASAKNGERAVVETKCKPATPTPPNTHTTNDLSLHREAYQKQADIIPAKILHQLCLPQVTGSRVSGESEREGEMGRREEREN